MLGPNGISLGIKSFGKSAPYKKIYEHFNLTSDNVVKLAKKNAGKIIMALKVGINGFGRIGRMVLRSIIEQ